MVRSLRPRKDRPSYASLLEPDNEGVIVEDADSSDEFQPLDEPEDAKDVELDVSDVESSQDLNVLPDQDESTSAKAARKRKKEKGIKTRKEGSSKASGRPPSGLATSAIDHRQRAEPLYLHSAQVERLIQPPHLFKPSTTTSTPCWNSTRASVEKFTKANGYNIGRGPIWELLEDRSWWKESLRVEEGMTETEVTRRPRVYESVRINTELKVINKQEAQEYLPKGGEPCSEYWEPTIKCHFGPPDKDVVKELKMFDTFDMIDDPPDAEAQVFFAGGPVWGLDWCPVYAEDHPYRSYTQYVAVAPLPSKSHSPRIGHKCPTPSPACVQIWSYSPKKPPRRPSMKGKEKATDSDDNFGRMTCDLVLCVDCGPAHELKWCPLPSHDSWAEPQSSLRKLGLLAGAFEDGSLSVFIVPDPEDLRPMREGGPIFVKSQPIVRMELEGTCIFTLDWANSEQMTVGCTNGSIAVYDIQDIVANGQMQEILPSHYFPVHQSAIRSVRWLPIPTTSAHGLLNFTKSPTMVASGGYDGCAIVTDIRDGYGCVLNRTRDVVLTVTYSRFSEGVVCVDLDNTVKTYSIAPGTLGRGNVVMEAGGPIWSLHTSDYHPFLALGSADGSVSITNMLRSTRRSASTPFLFHKIFQMDYSRKTGEHRMLDHFLPQELPDRSSISAKKKKKKEASETETVRTGIQGTGVWPAEVSATRVSWNNGTGLARAPLLASATASGLCRIDWLLGRFQDGRVPYGGIEYIRNETDNGTKMDEDYDE